MNVNITSPIEIRKVAKRLTQKVRAILTRKRKLIRKTPSHPSSHAQPHTHSRNLQDELIA